MATKGWENEVKLTHLPSSTYDIEYTKLPSSFVNNRNVTPLVNWWRPVSIS